MYPSHHTSHIIPVKILMFSHPFSPFLRSEHSKLPFFSLPFSSFYSPSSPSFLFSLFPRRTLAPSTGPLSSPLFLPFFPPSHPSERHRFIRRVEAVSVSAFPFFLYLQGFLRVIRSSFLFSFLSF